MKSYLAVVKNRFKKFLDYIIKSNMKCQDKYNLEQNYYDNEILNITKDLDKEYNQDIQNALDYIQYQKDLSTSIYLGN